MMAPDTPHEDRFRPDGRLAPPLDSLVDKIAAGEPAEDLVRNSMERVRETLPGPRSNRGPERRRFAVLALATVAALTCVSFVWYFSDWNGGRVSVVEETAPVELGLPARSFPDGPSIDRNRATPSPTVWSYHLAARSSPEELESLLDEHARQYAFGDPASIGLGDLL